MASDEGHTDASFLAQADALLRKNLTFQKQHIKQNITLIFFPAFLCVLMVGIQFVVNSQLNKPKFLCGCKCIPINQSDTCQNRCGLEFSNIKQESACSVPRPQEWPALIQIPGPQYRAVRTDSHRFTDLPHKSCTESLSCPVTSLFTGQNKSFAESLVNKMISNTVPGNDADFLHSASVSYLGTNSSPGIVNFIENAFLSPSPLEFTLPGCSGNLNRTVPVPLGNSTIPKEINCLQGLYRWRENSSCINKDLFQGFRKGNPANEINEIVGAYDFLNSNENHYNVSIWYNSTLATDLHSPRIPHLLRIPRPLNMVSNAFLHYFGSRGSQVLLSFVKEMPMPGQRRVVDLSVMLGPLLYAWVIQLLLPVFLMALVYEKQYKLRIMMKLHGLRDGPYWLITYSYFFFISSLYMIWFAAFGYIIGLDIFLLNSYAIQFIFYLLYLNLQIALAFLAGVVFSEVKTATVICYMYIFGSGLLGAFLFQVYIEDINFPRAQLLAMQLMPGFSLYRGLYDLSQYALVGHYQGTSGMRWGDLNEKNNGMKGTFILMTLEWMILLCTSYHLDQMVHSGNGKQGRSSSFLANSKKGTKLHTLSSKVESSTIIVDQEKYDLCVERYKVEQLLKQPGRTHPIFCHNLGKMYIGLDTNSNKHAVHSLSLAVSRGECFGMLGPNGSGKTTFISMMTGFLLPTSGTAFINNMDIRSEMHHIQTRIGICPQKDLIWEALTGREHLLFYGRLRNLKGAALQHAVEESLRTLGFYEGNVGDMVAGKYSGGMKRRLSVAISLIGDTQVVFLDEPTAGLDPESRNYLWHVVKLAKIGRAIILTTHSMEEAEFLCDRLGIIVNGRLQCLGSPRELKARYGRSYLLTISVDPLYKENVERMVANLSPNGVKVYDGATMQKFQLPKQDVRISQNFEALETLKRDIHVYDFGLTDCSLEDVFTNVVDEALDVPSKQIIV